MFEVCIKASGGTKQMISTDQILQQIEKQLGQAKVSDHEPTKREVLAAIRALCDVALNSTQSSSTHVFSPQNNPVTQMIPSPSAVASTPLKEQGANGESLFDF